MKVKEFAEKMELREFVCSEPDREVKGGYVGDLLSWVMGHAEYGQVWITIMSNQNIVAVATLAEPALIILSEDVQPDVGVLETARARGVNLYGSPLSSFELAGRAAALV